MSLPKQVLVAERDPAILSQLARALRSAGYATSEAASGRETLRFVQMEHPDLVVVGLHLQDIGGRDLARILESNGTSEPVRAIVVCDASVPADDCALTGGAIERAVLRWSSVDEVVTRVNGVFDLSVNDDPELFTFRFLHTLALNGERTCTRDELKRLVWGQDAEVIGRTVDVLVSRLRSKLTSATGREVISTVRGIGYRFTG